MSDPTTPLPAVVIDGVDYSVVVLPNDIGHGRRLATTTDLAAILAALPTSERQTLLLAYTNDAYSIAYSDRQRAVDSANARIAALEAELKGEREAHAKTRERAVSETTAAYVRQAITPFGNRSRDLTVMVMTDFGWKEGS